MPTFLIVFHPRGLIRYRVIDLVTPTLTYDAIRYYVAMTEYELGFPCYLTDRWI